MPEVLYESLPFNEAIDYFRQKGVNLPTKTWTDIMDGQHSKAFVVAGAQKAELLSDLRAAVDKAISQGTTITDFRKDFDLAVNKHGWSYKGQRGWRTGVIFNTNLHTAYSAGRYAQMTDPDILKAFPYWKYMPSVSAHKRPDHVQWYGIVLPASDPWWKTHWPANAWGCKCSVQNVTAAEYAMLKQSGTIRTTAPDDGTYEWTNPRTGEVLDIPKGIDPGWGHSLGESAWGRSWALTEMEKASAGKWIDVDPWPHQAYNRLDIVPADIPVANIGATVKVEQELRTALRDAIGGDEAFYTNPVGEKVMINQAIVDHMLQNPGKRWNGREAYFPFIGELIENPYEIWINFAKNELTGQYAIRAKYVKVIQLDKNQAISLIAETHNGLWTGFTFFSGRAGAAENLRMGRLLYGRK